MGESAVWGPGSAAGEMPPHTPRGFLRDVSEGIGRAVKSWPTLSACVLLGGVLSLSSGLSTIGMAHLAGMALRRVPGRTRLLLLMGWMSLAAAQWLLTSRSEGIPGWDLPVRASACVVALVWTAPRVEAWFALALTVAGTVLAGVMTGKDSQVPFLFAYLLWTSLPFVFLAVGRRGWFAASVAVAFVGVFAVITVQTISIGWFGGAMGILLSLRGLAVSVPSLLSATVAGAAVRAAEEGAPRDQGALLVTTLQRRPWMTGLALGTTLLLGESAVQLLPGVAGPDGLARLAIAAVFSASASLVVAIGVSAGTNFAMLTSAVPVCVASMATWGIGLATQSITRRTSVSVNVVLLLVAAIPPISLVTTWWALQVLGRRLAALLPFLLILAALLPQLLSLGGQDAWNGVALATIVLVPLAIVSVSATEVPAPRLLVTAALTGLASRLAAEFSPWTLERQLEVRSWFELPAAWFVAAAFAVFVRRIRSMTAVPLDHPMVVDFPVVDRPVRA